MGLCGPCAIGSQAQALADSAMGQELKLLTFGRSGCWPLRSKVGQSFFRALCQRCWGCKAVATKGGPGSEIPTKAAKVESLVDSAELRTGFEIHLWLRELFKSPHPLIDGIVKSRAIELQACA